MARLTAAATIVPQLIRKCYCWIISWAERENAVFFLFFLAVAEASFFPIPPDVLLIALGIAVPKKSFRWASVCLAGSVIGGILGYGLGYYFMAVIGDRILEFYHLMDRYSEVQALYRQYDAWAVAAGGFTPLPYKLFTITAGAFKINFLIFIAASLISRGLRFYMVAGAIYLFGPKVKYFLDQSL